MRFWDSSALVALFVEQERGQDLRGSYQDDPEVMAWILSDVEVRSALARIGRDGGLAPSHLQETVRELEAFFETVHLVSLVEPVKARAKRLLGVHPLRAADALQLAAALTASGDDPPRLELVTLDGRLAAAAGLEGFVVFPGNAASR